MEHAMAARQTVVFSPEGKHAATNFSTALSHVLSCVYTLTGNHPSTNRYVNNGGAVPIPCRLDGIPGERTDLIAEVLQTLTPLTMDTDANGDQRMERALLHMTSVHKFMGACVELENFSFDREVDKAK